MKYLFIVYSQVFGSVNLYNPAKLAQILVSCTFHFLIALSAEDVDIMELQRISKFLLSSKGL